MTHEQLLNPVTLHVAQFPGRGKQAAMDSPLTLLSVPENRKPCIREKRIYIAIILDAFAGGWTPEQIVEHYPWLRLKIFTTAVAYACELARENIWMSAS